MSRLSAERGPADDGDAHARELGEGDRRLRVQADQRRFAVRSVRARGPGSSAISAAAQRGARLFVGKGACVDCHSRPAAHRRAVPQHRRSPDRPRGPDDGRLPGDSTANAACDCVDAGSRAVRALGRVRRPQAPARHDGRTRRTERGCAADRWDWSGDKTITTRDAITSIAPLTDTLKGAWRTPSLRNVALTAPYMHDGRYATLQEVIWHYNTGGATPVPSRSARPRRADQAADAHRGEQADLRRVPRVVDGRAAGRGAHHPTLTHGPPSSCRVDSPGGRAAPAARAARGGTYGRRRCRARAGR